MLASLIPIETNFRIMKRAKWFGLFSVLCCVIALSVIWMRPFNKGIDFSGGVLFEVKAPVTAEDLRRDLSDFNPQIQSVGSTGDVFTIYLAQKGDEAEMNRQVLLVKERLGDGVEYRNTQVVGPKVGADLIKSGIWAVIIAILVMGLYIGIRFELPMAVGAVLSLTHDVIIALLILNLGGFEFGLTTLAALLTLAGYSINDTVVIYDRVRENLRKYKNRSLSEVIDMSINQTFSRTILTGFTTILAVGAIYLFGGEVLRGFSAVMLFGILIGTYSSVLLSTSSLLLFRKL